MHARALAPELRSMTSGIGCYPVLCIPVPLHSTSDMQAILLHHTVCCLQAKVHSLLRSFMGTQLFDNQESSIDWFPDCANEQPDGAVLDQVRKQLEAGFGHITIPPLSSIWSPEHRLPSH